MITIKLLLDPSQWLEVTWSDVTTVSATDESTEQVTTVPLYCQSYHPTQVQMLRDKAAEFGTSLDEHNDLLNMWQADYIPPDPEPIKVPQVITIRQAKLVLLEAGLLDDVDAAVAKADRVTQIEWEYATEVNRSWPTLTVLAALIGLSSDELDTLFVTGATK